MYRHLLVFPDGREVFSGADCDAAIQSVTVTQSVNTGQELTLGSACAAMLRAELITPAGNLTVTAGQPITVYGVDDKNNRSQIGVFYPEEPLRPTRDTMELTAYDAVSQSFDNCGFSDTRVSDKAGIVFAASGENTDQMCQLLFPSDHRIDHASLGKCVQILRVRFKYALLFGHGAFLGNGCPCLCGCILRFAGNAQKLPHLMLEVLHANAAFLQKMQRHTGILLQQRHEKMLRAHTTLPEFYGLQGAAFDNLLYTRRHVAGSYVTSRANAGHQNNRILDLRAADAALLQ